LNVRPGINKRLTYVCSFFYIFRKKTRLYVNICTRYPQSLSSIRARRDHYPVLGKKVKLNARTKVPKERLGAKTSLLTLSFLHSLLFAMRGSELCAGPQRLVPLFNVSALRYPTMSAKALYFQAVQLFRSFVRSFVRTDIYCYLDIS